MLPNKWWIKSIALATPFWSYKLLLFSIIITNGVINLEFASKLLKELFMVYGYFIKFLDFIYTIKLCKILRYPGMYFQLICLELGTFYSIYFIQQLINAKKAPLLFFRRYYQPLYRNIWEIFFYAYANFYEFFWIILWNLCYQSNKASCVFLSN